MTASESQSAREESGRSRWITPITGLVAFACIGVWVVNARYMTLDRATHEMATLLASEANRAEDRRADLQDLTSLPPTLMPLLDRSVLDIDAVELAEVLEEAALDPAEFPDVVAYVEIIDLLDEIAIACESRQTECHDYLASWGTPLGWLGRSCGDYCELQ